MFLLMTLLIDCHSTHAPHIPVLHTISWLHVGASIKVRNPSTMEMTVSRLNERSRLHECAIIINTRPMYPIFDEIESLVCHFCAAQINWKREQKTNIPMESKCLVLLIPLPVRWFFHASLVQQHQLKSIFLWVRLVCRRKWDHSWCWLWFIYDQMNLNPSS